MKYRSRCAAAVAVLAFSACHASEPTPAAASTSATQAQTTQVIDSRVVVPATPVDGIAIHELSGLAWDADDQRVFAVSDTGYLYQFTLKRDGDKLVSVTPLRAVALADPNHAVDARKKFNAEGLEILGDDDGRAGDTVLGVAMEGKAGPEVLRVNLDGMLLGEAHVPSPVNDYANYDDSKHGLESVAHHPQYGLITTPESPLSANAGTHTLYADGHQWSFNMYAPDSRLKGLDVMPDGKILILERAEMGDKHARIAVVRLLDPGACGGKAPCVPKTLAVLPPSANNFEGITHLDSRHLLIVTDDKGGKHSLKTIFVLLTLPQGI